MSANENGNVYRARKRKAVIIPHKRRRGVIALAQRPQRDVDVPSRQDFNRIFREVESIFGESSVTLKVLSLEYWLRFPELIGFQREGRKATKQIEKVLDALVKKVLSGNMSLLPKVKKQRGRKPDDVVTRAVEILKKGGGRPEIEEELLGDISSVPLKKGHSRRLYKSAVNRINPKKSG